MLSHVSSIETPEVFIGTRKILDSSLPSKLAETSTKSSTGDRVVKIFLPVSRHPTLVFTATVCGLPPRVGLPVDFSDAALFISEPCFKVCSHTFRKISSFHGLFSERFFMIPICQPT